MEKYRKLEYIKHKDFRKLHTYIELKSLENARMAFRIRCKMVTTITNKFRNSYKNLKCENFSTVSLNSQSHAVMCAIWEE